MKFASRIVPALLAAAAGQALAQPFVGAGDIVIGWSRGSATPTQQQLDDTIQLFTQAGVQKPDSWNQFAFIQSVEWDNTGGIRHNPNGKLFGMDFGAVGTGARIYRYESATGWAVQPFFNDAGGTAPNFLSFPLTITRAAGLSVSPNNQRVAIAGFDSGQVIVFDYDTTTGIVSAARQTNTIGGLLTTLDSSGTAWLDDNTVVAFSSSGQLWTVNATTMVETPQIDVGAGLGNSEFTSLVHNPTIAPFIYCQYSNFASATQTTTNKLFVVDPRVMPWVVVKEVDLSTSANTMRETGLSTAGDLYFTTVGTSSIIATLQKLANVTNPAGLVDNSSVVVTTSSIPASFSGMDVAAGTPSTGGGCFANCDASTVVPFLNVNDFVCFLNLFATGSTAANCDGSTAAPILNVNDFICFNNLFAAGCSAP
ncbi:MAG: GC-type dockerin domain-anchored protein [Phycisphaerales bacterium]